MQVIRANQFCRKSENCGVPNIKLHPSQRLKQCNLFSHANGKNTRQKERFRITPGFNYNPPGSYKRYLRAEKSALQHVLALQPTAEIIRPGLHISEIQKSFFCIYVDVRILTICFNCSGRLDFAGFLKQKMFLMSELIKNPHFYLGICLSGTIQLNDY